MDHRKRPDPAPQTERSEDPLAKGIFSPPSSSCLPIVSSACCCIYPVFAGHKICIELLFVTCTLYCAEGQENGGKEN